MTRPAGSDGGADGQGQTTRLTQRGPSASRYGRPLLLEWRVVVTEEAPGPSDRAPHAIPNRRFLGFISKRRDC
jgi:hypothetical protein